jgi:redox-sensitive bicupin YhaK (pirin superfamily)
MSNGEPGPVGQRLTNGEKRGGVEVLPARAVPLGGPRAMTVFRTLPQIKRSLVGSWCFLDHYGPQDVAVTGGMEVPRHPHTGLATVSWLFSGQVQHVDSGGTTALVQPGELNLMIAGQGITHSEVSTSDTKTLHGVQLWYALPQSTRFSASQFVRYRPVPLASDGVVVRVFIGELFGSRSPVVTQTADLLGAELLLEPHASIELAIEQNFEHAVLAETGDIQVNHTVVPHRSLGYVPIGCTTLQLAAGSAGARLMLLGGEPLGEQIVMWWNFVARTHEEIVEFRRRYQAELGFSLAHPQDAGKTRLFGEFPPGHPVPLPAPALPRTRLLPRR